jgi:hypothetical protein
MDYIVFSGLQHSRVQHYINTSDIWCNYGIKLRARHDLLPPNLQLDLDNDHTIEGAIPKFHEPAHGKRCHTTYSLNYLPGVGQTDGEGIERDWSSVNGAARSTKEMGEGSRHDALDDIWGDTNYRKVIGFGELSAQFRSNNED